MKKKTKGLKYQGKSAHLSVPRRDLTPEEVEQFGLRWLLKLRCANMGKPLYAEFKEKKQAISEEVT